MLTELCQELRNWFFVEGVTGRFVIEDGQLTDCSFLQNGQYFRIIGSVFNDGVHQYQPDYVPAEGETPDLADETFDGTIWAMAVPPSVIALSEQIDAWNAKYGTVDSQAMSPYNSESFGGYSYSKSGGGSGSGSSSPTATWQSMFASALNRWRKI